MRTKLLILIFFLIYSNVFSIPIIEKLDFDSLGLKNNYQVPITSFNGKNIAIGTNKLRDSNFIISTDYGKSWQLSKIDTLGSYRSENNSLFELHFVDETTLIAVLANNIDSSWTKNGQNYKTSYQIGFILKSTDFGKSWKEKVIDYKHAVIHLNMPTSNYGIFRQEKQYKYTSNCWETWNDAMMPGYKYNYLIQVLCPKENLHIIVSLIQGTKIVKVFKSEDEGLTWDSTLVLPDGANRIIFVNEHDILAYGNSAHFFRTNDYGKQWEKIEVKCDTAFQNIIQLVRLNSHRFVFITQNNLIFTNDNWKTSEIIDLPQLEKSETLSSITKINENQVLLCTYYGDIYSIIFDEVGINDKIKNEPEFVISPNPASDYIELVPPREKNKLGSILEQIQIFDIFGNRVLTVETQNFVSLQRIDISSFSAGVYFVRIGNEKPMKFVKL